MKVLKWLGYSVLALIAVSIPSYWWLMVESHKPETGLFSIDIAEVRRLAESSAGDKPQLIRVETVAHFFYPKTFVVAGDGWQNTDLPVSSYELVYPDHSVILDTAFSAEMAKDLGADTFDSGAYARMSAALAKADLIIATHEHPDHIGGLLAQPDLKKLLDNTRLTQEQVSELEKSLNTKPLVKLHLAADLFKDYRPLEYDRYHVIAPGVVLIKTPGHTPGHQMVYVKRADGAEILFLGDVAWQMRNIDVMRERARLVTWLASEDREAVMRELIELNRLHTAEPALHMMPGHDAAALEHFLKTGLLAKGP